MARVFIILGILLIVIGLAMAVLQKAPFFGKFPGDIVIRKEHFTFYFPLATSIVISIIVSLIAYLIGKFR